MERVDDYKALVASKYNDFHESVKRAATVYAEYGRRYVKISVGNTVHSFIELETGNILKAATYKAPAKNGVRGSIWSDDCGASVIDWYGTKYLK